MTMFSSGFRTITRLGGITTSNRSGRWGSATVVAVLSLFVAGLLLRERQCLKVAFVLLLPVGACSPPMPSRMLSGRPRPMVGHPPKALSNSSSFPSGHASMSMTGFLVAAVALREFWRRLGVRGVYPYVVGWAIAVAGMVGLSRLYFGFHYPSDVLGGWLLGVALADPGKNPICFVVPCHRVVGKNGDITGYHWGITRKRAMLGWEAGMAAA